MSTAGHSWEEAQSGCVNWHILFNEHLSNTILRLWELTQVEAWQGSESETEREQRFCIFHRLRQCVSAEEVLAAKLGVSEQDLDLWGNFRARCLPRL